LHLLFSLSSILREFVNCPYKLMSSINGIITLLLAKCLICHYI
jgi:hypothetical protein